MNVGFISAKRFNCPRVSPNNSCLCFVSASTGKCVVVRTTKSCTHARTGEKKDFAVVEFVDLKEAKRWVEGGDALWGGNAAPTASVCDVKVNLEYQRFGAKWQCNHVSAVAHYCFPS